MSGEDEAMPDRDGHRQAEDANRILWDEMARVHVRAYKEVRLLRDGKEILDEIELREIGEVGGRRLLHLQCHIGTDTLAWARHGAAVTGVDFSAEAIACARRLRDELGLEAKFIQANIYDLPSLLSEKFDIVYSSRGVLCWLRELGEWAKVVAHFLVPGGIFYLMESHPILNALQEQSPGLLLFAHSYFHLAEPMRWEPGVADYADPSHHLEHPSYEWTWTMSDVLTALLKAGLELELLNEYDRLFFRLFPSMVSEDGRWYTLRQYSDKLPLLFTLRAHKPG